MIKKENFDKHYNDSNLRVKLTEEAKHCQLFKEVLHDFKEFEKNCKSLYGEQKKESVIESLTRPPKPSPAPKVQFNEPTFHDDLYKYHSLKKFDPDSQTQKSQILNLNRSRFNTLILGPLSPASKPQIKPLAPSLNPSQSKLEDQSSTAEDEHHLEIIEKEILFDKVIKEFRAQYQRQGDLYKLQACYRVIGNEYLEKNNVKEALKYFQAFKILCDRAKTWTIKMSAYKEIGFCYKLVKQYRSALINFKKLLQLAWFKSHKGWELQSYDFIGIAYYYLGELEKAKYYHRRMWEGIFESSNSTVRNLAVNALKLKIEAKNLNDDRGLPQIKDDSSYIISQSDEEENDLPSPRTGSGEENLKLLPFYSPRKDSRMPFLSPSQRITNRKNTIHKSMSNRIRPFMLISHLSPNESPNNYFYVEQMSSFRVRGEVIKN